MQAVAAPSRPLRLLLLEDQAADAELCERELKRAGLVFDTRCVATRSAFEAALDQFAPDLIISDFSLPNDFNGLAALEISKQKSPHVPFVFVSGTIGEERAVEAMRRGATDYVLKDRLNRLVPVVKRVLDELHERAARQRAEAEVKKQEQRIARLSRFRSVLSAAEKLSLESRVRTALREEQFVLHYQPRLTLATGRISGVEALLRWSCPERGLVPPGEFISLLEETGMILEVGQWALTRAATDHAAWRAQGLNPPRIAVNVSGVQMRQRDFVASLMAAVALSGGVGWLDIELTESILMDDVESNIRKLSEIRALGIGIAIDDFGTGYSSLSYLVRLPLDMLKIDRSFVSLTTSSPQHMAIVSTIISLARSLNLKVTAEGVETDAQRNLLRLLKCDEMQGFLFSDPLPSRRLVELLQAAEVSAGPTALTSDG